MRKGIVLFISGFIFWLVINLINFDTLSVKTYSYIMELLFFVALYIMKYHSKEMLKRIVHNNERRIDVEIKNYSDLLGNLVPPPVLQGIKND